MHFADSPAALAAFADAVGPWDHPLALVPAAFAVARTLYPDLDEGPDLARLSQWGEAVRERLAEGAYPMQRIRALVAVLFGDVGLIGDRDTYYDPRNSCLNDVMARRLGIPITLGVITMAVAEQAGIALEGVGFPGHFLVRYVGDDDSFILLDPFQAGAILIEADCEARFRQQFGDGATFDARALSAVSHRQIIARMLLNLKGIYLHTGAHAAALAMVDRLLLLDPTRQPDRRDQGMLLLSLQRLDEGKAALMAYLAAAPDAPDGERVRRLLESL